jgi:hypothetical protein
VPNTTAVTQETDWTYGLFKSKYRANLENLVDELVRLDKSVSVPQYKHGLLVFGGVDPDTGLHLDLAFEEGFSCKNCLESWAKIGAAPLTHKCLKDPQVRKSMDMDKDYVFLVNSVQEANDYAVYALTEGGYDGSALQALVAIKPADNDNGDIIVRLWETTGSRTQGTLLVPGFAVVCECDALEVPNGDAWRTTDGAIQLTVEAFQIRTLRLSK